MAQLPETPNTEFQNWKGILLTPKSLYIWSINKNVTDSQLFDLFNQVAQVVSAGISRDSATGESLGFGYVHFNSNEDARKALNELNYTLLSDTPIWIANSTSDIDRRENAAKVFVKNIDKGIGKTQLYDMFSTFGNIISCHFERNPSHRSKGYGYVNFENEESAQNAIDNLNGELVNDKELHVSHFQLKEDKESLFSGNNSKFTNLFVKNLSKLLTEDDLKMVFGRYGTITSAAVMRYKDGSSKCYGFVDFENPDSAAKAVDGLNGMKFDSKKWCVRKAMKKSERDLEMMKNLDQIMKEAADRHQYVELYIRNLNYSIMDETLRELFSEFGRITSYKVIKGPNGISKGHGFVVFSTPEEANRALYRMNGKVVAGRVLDVHFAHRKAESIAMLQAQFSQMRPVRAAPPVAPHMPLYSPRAPAPGPQFLDGQPPPVIIPQAAIGYQQQLVPGMRRAPFPNFIFPRVQQGQHDPWSGGHQEAGPSQQPQHAVPMLHQQMLHRGDVDCYPPLHNTQDDPWPAVAGGMLPIPNDMGDLPIWDALEETMATRTLAIRTSVIWTLVTALANAPPEHHRTMLRQVLYPLVDYLEPDSAEIVTGMILMMDQPKVLHLIESPDALKEEVAEAMYLLRSIMAAQDQLASLSMN